jgi:hypothetical protein
MHACREAQTPTAASPPQVDISLFLPCQPVVLKQLQPHRATPAPAPQIALLAQQCCTCTLHLLSSLCTASSALPRFLIIQTQQLLGICKAGMLQAWLAYRHVTIVQTSSVQAVQSCRTNHSVLLLLTLTNHSNICITTPERHVCLVKSSCPVHIAGVARLAPTALTGCPAQHALHPPPT